MYSQVTLFLQQSRHFVLRQSSQTLVNNSQVRLCSSAVKSDFGHQQSSQTLFCNSKVTLWSKTVKPDFGQQLLTVVDQTMTWLLQNKVGLDCCRTKCDLTVVEQSVTWLLHTKIGLHCCRPKCDLTDVEQYLTWPKKLDCFRLVL
jgi:hypothetical protein